MKVLVTGAAGFIGSHMAEKLKSSGIDVLGVDNFSGFYSPKLKRRTAEYLNRNGIELLKSDLRCPDFYKSLPEDINFIFHFAAHPGNSPQSTYKDYYSNNVLATKLICEYAIQKNIEHFFNISTSSVYGLNATLPETAKLFPVSNYGKTKLKAEKIVLEAAEAQKLKASSYRLYSVYGPRERPDKLFSKLLHAGFNRCSFPLFSGSESHKRSFTFVEDITSGLFNAFQKYESLNNEIFNIGIDKQYSTAEGIAIVEAITKAKIDIDRLPERKGDQLQTLANINKAKKILSYKPTTSLENGLKKQFQWYKSEYFKSTTSGQDHELFNGNKP